MMDRQTYDMLIEVLAMSMGAIAAAPDANDRYKAWLLDRVVYCRDHLVAQRDRLLEPLAPMPQYPSSIFGGLRASLKAEPLTPTTEKELP